MTDSTECANLALDRLFSLDSAMLNVCAFRALLSELHTASAPVPYPHSDAAHMVRAAILRSMISGLMACLDRGQRDRASIGQVLKLLKRETTIAAFANCASAIAKFKSDLGEIEGHYKALIVSADFISARALRDRVIAHNLVNMPPVSSSEYEGLYRLFDGISSIINDLHALTGRRMPQHIEDAAKIASSASLFWDTYRLGIKSGISS